jgi:hypothetical protein
MARTNNRATSAFTYVLVSDRELPPEQQTEFVLRPLTVDEYAAAIDGIVRTVVDREGTRTVVNRTRQQGIALALDHIIDVHNFPVGSPQPWPDEREKRRDYLGMLMPADLHEVTEQLYQRAVVGDEEKNFSPPARTSASGGNSPGATSTTAPPAANAG